MDLGHPALLNIGKKSAYFALSTAARIQSLIAGPPTNCLFCRVMLTTPEINKGQRGSCVCGVGSLNSFHPFLPDTVAKNLEALPRMVHSNKLRNLDMACCHDPVDWKTESKE